MLRRRSPNPAVAGCASLLRSHWKGIAMADFDSKDYGDRLRRDIHAEIEDRIQRKVERRHYRHSGRFGAIFGAVIAGLGVLLLLENLGLIQGDIWRYLWPVILI